jgi:competence protein ComEA
MVRPSRSAELDEQSAARERLEAMRLRSAGGGWVPEHTVGRAGDDRLDAPEASPEIAAEPDRPTPLPIGELIRGWAMDRSPPWAHHLLESLRLRGLLAAVGVLAAVIVVGFVVVHHHAAAQSSYGYSGSSAPVVADPAPSQSSADVGDAGSIVVDVGGRVRKPGLVTLPAGARVADAIAAAGGPLHHKEIATLDLAARVSDGQLLLIGVKDESSSGASDGTDDSSGSGAAAPVGLNSATIDELETLPGVGPVTAQKIIDWRTAHNGFTAVSQLQQISGIGPAKYAELSPLVTP